MKALISPLEPYTYTWISSWVWVSKPTLEKPDGGYWDQVYSSIEDCQRVAEVEPDDKMFDVAPPLHWVDCPDTCVADAWYFKDGQVSVKPLDVPMPSTPVETMP
jgi:hypothetical protein